MGLFTSSKMSELHKTNQELTQQLLELTKANELLTREVEQLKEEITYLSISDDELDLNTNAIKEFVETMLDDENINIAYFPDAVERAIYTNVFTIALGMIQKILSTTEIKLLSHIITLRMRPTE